MSINTATQPLRSVRLANDGLVFEGYARKRGDVLQVTPEEADRLVRIGAIAPEIKVRALRSGILVGGRSTAYGECFEVPWEHRGTVIARHAAYEIDVIDPPVSLELPDRGPRPLPPRGFVRLRATRAKAAGKQPFGVGEEFDVAASDARGLVANAMAELIVGNLEGVHAGIRVKSNKSNLNVAGHVLAYGEVAVVPWEHRGRVAELYREYVVELVAPDDRGRLERFGCDLDRKPRRPAAAGYVRMRGLAEGKYRSGPFARGEVFDAPVEEVRGLIASGLAEETDPPHAEDIGVLVKVRVLGTGLTRGLRRVPTSEVVDLDATLARRLIPEGVVELAEGSRLPGPATVTAKAKKHNPAH
jgi:hypothetical protein